jgi:hypothetical protein
VEPEAREQRRIIILARHLEEKRARRARVAAAAPLAQGQVPFAGLFGATHSGTNGTPGASQLATS